MLTSDKIFCALADAIPKLEQQGLIPHRKVVIIAHPNIVPCGIEAAMRVQASPGGGRYRIRVEEDSSMDPTNLYIQSDD